MATREENLKKINDELEQLSDEELEQVAGGDYYQTSKDSKFLYKLGLLGGTYEAKEIGFASGTETEQKIRDAFQKLGIGFVWSGWGNNHYYAGQQCLSQEEAWRVAEANAKQWKLGIYSE